MVTKLRKLRKVKVNSGFSEWYVEMQKRLDIIEVVLIHTAKCTGNYEQRLIVHFPSGYLLERDIIPWTPLYIFSSNNQENLLIVKEKPGYEGIPEYLAPIELGIRKINVNFSIDISSLYESYSDCLPYCDCFIDIYAPSDNRRNGMILFLKFKLVEMIKWH